MSSDAPPSPVSAALFAPAGVVPGVSSLGLWFS
jgi:hypothetical protein